MAWMSTVERIIMTTTTMNSQAMTRNPKVRKKSLARSKRITATADGVDQRLLDAFLELVAEAVDMHLDDVRRSFPVRLPQALAQHLPRDHQARVPHEHLE